MVGTQKRIWRSFADRPKCTKMYQWMSLLNQKRLSHWAHKSECGSITIPQDDCDTACFYFSQQPSTQLFSFNCNSKVTLKSLDSLSNFSFATELTVLLTLTQLMEKAMMAIIEANRNSLHLSDMCFPYHNLRGSTYWYKLVFTLKQHWDKSF